MPRLIRGFFIFTERGFSSQATFDLQISGQATFQSHLNS